MTPSEPRGHRLVTALVLGMLVVVGAIFVVFGVLIASSEPSYDAAEGVQPAFGLIVAAIAIPIWGYAAYLVRRGRR